VSPGMVNAVDFLRRPPLPLAVRAAYRVLYWAAVATIPVSIRTVIGVKRLPGAIVLGKITIVMLRWVLGSSPSWALALKRVDAELPEGHRFREQ